MVQAGQSAPEFTLQDADGQWVNLRAFRGKRVILYFYPEDDTAGCTTEACGFRDDHADYVGQDAIILGVSPDDVASHARFVRKYGLPFRLLADPDHAVAERYGAWKLRRAYGKTFWGIERTTFLIDEHGNVARVFSKVRAQQHSREVLEALQAV